MNPPFLKGHSLSAVHPDQDRYREMGKAEAYGVFLCLVGVLHSRSSLGGEAQVHILSAEKILLLAG